MGTLDTETIEHLNSVQVKHNIRVFTCEAQIIFALMRGELSSQELFYQNSNSNTAFYLTLNMLLSKKVIVKKKSKLDKRVTQYSLNSDQINLNFSEENDCKIYSLV